MNNEEILRRACLAYEAELKKRMTPEEYTEFTQNVAKMCFAEDILGMADSKFKEICLDNFAALTGSEDEFMQLMEDFDDTNIDIDDPGDLGDEDY